MHRINKQRGMTAIGWVIVLGLLAFFTLLTLRLLPLYLEYGKVSSAFESLYSEPGITKKPVSEIRKMLGKKLYINEVREIDKRLIDIKNKGNVLTVSIEYERRVPMVGNIDAIASFKKEVQVIGN
jgi:hypothetical protein